MDPTPQKPARRLPATIGRYRVLGRLGKGAMGIVYSAYDDVMARPVAIKVMMADLQDDPETSARFYREAQAAGQLVHRNIITIFDMGDEDGRPYIVMELLEGQTLGDYLKRPEGVPLEGKIALMVQLCDGLQLAHDNGIFHRDIKPGNLLIGHDGRLTIVDFGIARLATSSMTVTGLIVGTPDYMSPEQAAGREVDRRSDIFSAGAVFYYMLTGRKPFAAADLPAVLDKVKHDDPLPLRDSEAPPELATVVMKALAKSPGERYQQAGEVMAELTRFSRELALETRRASERARLQIDAVDALAADRLARCRELGIEPGPTDVDEFRRQVQQRYPTFADWRDGRSREPPHHAAVQDLQQEVSALHKRLEDEVAVVRQSASDLQSGERAASDGAWTQALRHFDAVCQTTPGCERAREEGARIRGLLAQKQAADEKAQALLLEAKSAAARAEWPSVLALTAQALSIDAGNVKAAALRDLAGRALVSEAQRRQAQCRQALDRAEKLLRKGRYADAERWLERARGFDPDSPTAPVLDARIRAARLDAERATERERWAAGVIAAARIAFASGARDQALSDLRRSLEHEPQSASLSAALAKFAAQAERLRAEERRRAEAADYAAAADAALQGDDPERALTIAQQALGVDQGEPVALKVQSLATARLRERAIAKERRDSAERALEAARTLLGRGDFAAARELVRSTANLNPADPEPRTLLAAIDDQEGKARERDLREREAQRRANAAGPVLALAKAAEEKQDFIRAGWFAENALALDLECAEARRIIESVRARLAAQPDLAEETVEALEGGEPAADRDETLTFDPGTPARGRVADSLKNWWRTTVASTKPRPTPARRTK